MSTSFCAISFQSAAFLDLRGIFGPPMFLEDPETRAFVKRLIELGVKQKELAARLGARPSWFNKWLKQNRGELSAGMLHQLSRYFADLRGVSEEFQNRLSESVRDMVAPAVAGPTRAPRARDGADNSVSEISSLTKAASIAGGSKPGGRNVDMESPLLSKEHPIDVAASRAFPIGPKALAEAKAHAKAIKKLARVAPDERGGRGRVAHPADRDAAAKKSGKSGGTGDRARRNR
jgi:transcriptional regulator with XRE-family HTH domain